MFEVQRYLGQAFMRNVNSTARDSIVCVKHKPYSRVVYCVGNVMIQSAHTFWFYLHSTYHADVIHCLLCLCSVRLTVCHGNLCSLASLQLLYYLLIMLMLGTLKPA